MEVLNDQISVLLGLVVHMYDVLVLKMSSKTVIAIVIVMNVVFLHFKGSVVLLSSEMMRFLVQ